MRPLQIEWRQSRAGGVTGAVVCALGGSQIGHGSSAHAAGAVVGALIGNRVGVLSDGYTTSVTR